MCIWWFILSEPVHEIRFTIGGSTCVSQHSEIFANVYQHFYATVILTQKLSHGWSWIPHFRMKTRKEKRGIFRSKILFCSRREKTSMMPVFVFLLLLIQSLVIPGNVCLFSSEIESHCKKLQNCFENSNDLARNN